MDANATNQRNIKQEVKTPFKYCLTHQNTKYFEKAEIVFLKLHIKLWVMTPVLLQKTQYLHILYSFRVFQPS